MYKLNKWLRAFLNIKHIMAIFIAMCFFSSSMLLYSSSIKSISNYQRFLKTRNYNYSITIDKDLGVDCYAYYNKNITFSKMSNLNTTINAIVLMETGSEHTKNDFLNGYDVALKENEVLISANLAKQNKLKIGTYIYSKSKVTTLVEKYIVKDIIDDVYGFRKNDIDKDKGIIITGKASQYLENIETNYLYFYYEDYSLINKCGANITGELNNINDLKESLVFRHLFYSIITSLLIVSIAIILVIVLRSFNHNIYKKKWEFGIDNINKQVFINQFIYYIVNLLFGYICYFLLTIFSNSSLEIVLMFFLINTIVFALSFIDIKRVIKKR